MTTLDILLRLYGVGPNLAKKIYQALLKEKLIQKSATYTEDEIRQKLLKSKIINSLPTITITDLKDKPDKIIPRPVIDVINAELKKHLKEFKFEIAGSYRRQTKTSRDIDIVLIRGRYKSANSINNTLTNAINKSKIIQMRKPYAIGGGKIATLFDVKLTNARATTYKIKNNWRPKVDIFITSAAEYAPMLLYATGSGQLNIIMRGRAKKQGMLLNQKGLYKITGDKLTKIPTKTEKDIFEKINMKYREPKSRSIPFIKR